MGAAIIEIRREGDEEARFTVEVAEAGWENPDDGVGDAVDDQLAIEHVRRATELLMPEFVREDDDLRVCVEHFVLGERASPGEGNAEGGEELRRHPIA